MADNHFDAAFYERFYLDPRTQVTTRTEMARRARLIAAVVQYVDLPVKRILDAGCGLGWMCGALQREFPDATYRGLEVSEHLCDRYGWTRGSLADYQSRARFDLIVCYDVLQYLTDRDAARALANLARLSRGALYFDTATVEDWQRNADLSCSDRNIHLRSADWYRDRLARHFRHMGWGVYIRRGVPVVQWELERAVSEERNELQKKRRGAKRNRLKLASKNTT